MTEPLDPGPIEKRAEAATAGPWHRFETSVVKPTLPHISYRMDVVQMERDAEFIAHAREDVPALCRALRAEREKVGRMRAETIEECARVAEERELTFYVAHPATLEELWAYIAKLHRVHDEAVARYGERARVMIPDWCPSPIRPSIASDIRSLTRGEG